MKKTVVFSALISVGTLICAANQPQKPQESKMTPQEYINFLKKEQKKLEQQISQEAQKQINEEIQKVSIKSQEENINEVNAFQNFILGFDLTKNINECSKKNETACLNIKKYKEMVDTIKPLIKIRDGARQIEIISTPLNIIREKYPKLLPVFAELQKIHLEYQNLQQ